MQKTAASLILTAVMIFSTASFLPGCSTNAVSLEPEQNVAQNADFSYSYMDYPLERNGISLHLDCIKKNGVNPDKNIILIHGVTYSSHEFDINYEDYSLVRFLAREGYAVWRLDIAGFGQSGDFLSN